MKQAFSVLVVYYAMGNVQLLLMKQVTQRKLKKLEKDYQSFLEQQTLLEDPVVRLEVIHVWTCLLCTIIGIVIVP